jgi:hypothetical protein
MTVRPDDAAAALEEIAAVERRTRETLFYAGSSSIFIVWGVIGVVGYLFSWFWPRYDFTAWIILDAVGFAATFAILALRKRRAPWRASVIRWGATYLAFMAYGALMLMELAPHTGRQVAVFWPTMVMFGYVLMGIWIGLFIAYIGIAATILIVVGYYWLGGWFLPWLALVFGGGLIAAGLWLRRVH